MLAPVAPPPPSSSEGFHSLLIDRFWITGIWFAGNRLQSSPETHRQQRNKKKKASVTSSLGVQGIPGERVKRSWSLRRAAAISTFHDGDVVNVFTACFISAVFTRSSVRVLRRSGLHAVKNNCHLLSRGLNLKTPQGLSSRLPSPAHCLQPHPQRPRWRCVHLPHALKEVFIGPVEKIR